MPHPLIKEFRVVGHYSPGMIWPKIFCARSNPKFHIFEYRSIRIDRHVRSPVGSWRRNISPCLTHLINFPAALPKRVSVEYWRVVLRLWTMVTVDQSTWMSVDLLPYVCCS